jgi:hypothetical protein
MLVIGLKDIETFKLLVKNSKGLEALGFYHLRLEPVFNLILALIFQVLVCIVEVSKAN